MTRSVPLPRDAVLSRLLHNARSGSPEALGQLFEACRGYLLTVTRRELPGQLRAKVDAADVVQEAFIEATRDFPAFRGETAHEMLGWLRGILLHTLADLSKYFEACCRSLSQEVRLLDLRAAARTRAFRTAGGTICEQLIAQEQRRALDAALQRPPPAYREVLQLHYGESRCFAEIGSGMQRSAEAVRKIACRAVERLRQDMRIYAEV